MIDTVALRIDNLSSDMTAQWTVEAPEQFNNPDIENCYGSNWHTENRRSEAKQWKDYQPHVEIRQGNRPVYYYYLYVRFSVPKLIYGDNLREVTDPQFQTVCQTLQSKLQRMGVKVDLFAIQHALVEQVHYGKNLICYGIPVELVLKRLEAARLPRLRMDTQRTSYCNGRQLTFHNKIREVCLYDKYQELVTYRKQATSLAWFFGRKDLKNLLRLEVRLNKKASFKKHFGTNKVTFQNVFSEVLAKKVILEYWEPIYQSASKIPPECYAPEYQLLSLGNTTPNMVTDLELIGLRALVNSMGHTAAYKLMQARYPGNQQQVYALFAQLQKAGSLVLPAEYDYLRMIDEELRLFKWLGKYSWGRRKKLLRNATPLTCQRLLTVEYVAKYAKVNKRTVQRWLKKGLVGHFMFGKEYRLRKEDFLALLCGPKP